MANLLEQIGQGLRSGLRVAGAGLSPRVYESQEREREQFEQIKARRSEMVLQLAAQAAQSGSLSPQGFQQIAQKYGVDVAGFGPSREAQKFSFELEDLTKKKQQRSTYEKAIQEYETRARYEPPTEVAQSPQAIEVWRKRQLVDDYMRRAEIATQFQQEDEAKRWRELAQTEIQAQRLTLDKRGGAGTQYERALETLQRLQLKLESQPGQPLSRQEELEAQTARAVLEQQRMGLDPVTGQPYYSQPLTVPPSITVGQTGAGRPANVVPPLTSGRKPLDAGTEKEFQAMGDGRAQMTMLISGFKPGYGGFVSEMLGQGAIEGGRRGVLPQYKDMAQWWQGYEQWITDVRAAKFGMTLTGYELQQFNKYRVKPSDADVTIRENMTRQLNIVDRAIERRLGSVRKSGQNVQQAEELLGPRTSPITEEQAPTGTQLEWTSEDEKRLRELEERRRAP